MQHNREHCEFAGCGCACFRGGTRCSNCGHGAVWHARSRPPCDAKLAFYSTRAPARTPVYTSQTHYADAIESLPA